MKFNSYQIYIRTKFKNYLRAKFIQLYFMYAMVSQQRGIYHRTQYCINDLVSVSSFYLTNHYKIQWLTSIMYYSSCVCGLEWSWLLLAGRAWPTVLEAMLGRWPLRTSLMLQQEDSVISPQGTIVVGLATCHNATQA